MLRRAARRVASAARSRWPRVFWERAYRENVTGLAAMVAFNLALAIFPFALLLLFIFGQVAENASFPASVLSDLQGFFPAAERPARPAPRPDPGHSATIGVVADRRDLDRRVVLGRDGHRLPPDLSRPVPVGWSSSACARDPVVVTLFLAASVIVPVAEAVLTLTGSTFRRLDDVSVSRTASCS